MPLPPEQGLLERESELSQLAALLEEVREGCGAACVVEAAPGIGKTRLLQITRRRAQDVGMRVLTACGAPLERDYPFGIVRQLFEPLVLGSSPQERSAMLSGAARLAAAVFDDRAVSSEGRPRADTNPVLYGLYWLVSNLAERGPVLLTVDDAHWCDAASLRFLGLLVRRVEELPVAVLLAARRGEDQSLSEILSDTAARVLSPGPLSAAGVFSLVECECSTKPDEQFVEACQAVTGGNPFLLRELLGELVSQGVDPTDPTADNVELVGKLAPRRVGRSVLFRLQQLSEGASALARATAILGDGAQLRHAAALAELEAEVAEQAADALIQAEVFEPGRPLRFVHSIVRDAVYDQLPHSERSRGHQRAALILNREQAPLQQVVAHLLAADPAGDATVVELLREAADQALAEGAPEVAKTYLVRALEEPPDDDVRGRLLVELCIAEARLPGAEGLESLRRGMEATSDPNERAALALELAHAIGMVADTGSALEVLEGAIAQVADLDDSLTLRLEAEYITVARLHPPSRSDALERLRRYRDRATPDDLAGSILLANRALDAVETLQPAEEAAGLAQQALETGLLLDEEQWVFAYAANTLTWTDRAREADLAWQSALAEARRRGSVTIFHLASIWRSHLAYRTGAVGDAEADARLGLDVCRRHAWGFSLAYALAFLVDALVERGELETATRFCDEAPGDPPLHYLLHARGRLRCAQKRFGEGLEDFLECGRQLEARGEERNPAVIPWRSSAALALGCLDRREEGRRLAHEELDHARAFGAPRACGMALRATALLEEGEAQLDRLRMATEVLERSPARLEHARALTDLGAALRRAGRRSEAQDCLRTALDIAYHCGAAGVRASAQEELLSTGMRPRRFALTGVDALTPSERRVAEMAAEGLRNREVAQALFVSLKTVETHLSSAYRKLDVTARSQLAQALAAGSQ